MLCSNAKSVWVERTNIATLKTDLPDPKTTTIYYLLLVITAILTESSLITRMLWTSHANHSNGYDYYYVATAKAPKGSQNHGQCSNFHATSESIKPWLPEKRDIRAVAEFPFCSCKSFEHVFGSN